MNTHDITSTLTLTQVDTTEGSNGYPRALRVAYTANTMGELREAYDAAKAEGCEVNIVRLYRRDGWALWERRGHEYALDDDQWMGTSEGDWIIDVDKDSDREGVAFDHICGGGWSPESADELYAKAEAVRELALDLADPDGLEEGETVRHWMDGSRIMYTVKTGDTAYSYDTHQWCIALEITEPEEEEEEEEEEQ